MGKTIFYIVFSRVQEERHSKAALAPWGGSAQGQAAMQPQTV